MDVLSTAAALCLLCAPGEYELHVCTASTATVCWPCSPGHYCVNGNQTHCSKGLWSGRGMSGCDVCTKCGVGELQARTCDGVSDTVCAHCPAGFGCDGSDVMLACVEGEYSTSNGVCAKCPENRTTLVSGAVGVESCVCEMDYDNGTNCFSCPVGWQFVAGACRECPAGHGCDSEHNVRVCGENTYSSKGDCVQCASHATSGFGSASEAACICDDGYVKIQGQCSACKAGTVFVNGQCVLCKRGEYCLGKTHHEPCPNDTYAGGGAAMCSQCRLNSECRGECIEEKNCSCIHGYIERGGECRRCPAGTWAVGVDHCAACEPGFECAGGPEVRRCEIGTYSPGNLSQCHGCLACEETTLSRCNATQDSVCEKTAYPLAVIDIWQQFRSYIDGEMFLMFAMVLASSIPKTQLVKVCDMKGCVRCFQGMCPAAGSARMLLGPVYEISMEIRTDVTGLSTSIESLTQSKYLDTVAQTTMAKLTDAQFSVYSRVEHRVICPDGAVWDGKMCQYPTNRTWVGLGIVSVVLIVIGVVGMNRKRRDWVFSMETVKQATDIDDDYADEKTPVVGGK